MVRYTISVCNYNMADTIERSLRSMLDQVDDRFEMVVVDDGSTDGSLEILERLEKEYGMLRVIYGNNSNIAEARNQSFKEARGDYILKSLDTDDVYNEHILDFVHIFEELNEQVEEDFYLKGNSINMASRDLLLSFPYRSVGWGEDQDLWRQLFAEDKIIWLDHKSFAESIGYDYNWFQRTHRTYQNRIADLRGGITVRSLAKHIVSNASLAGAIFHCSLLPIAYLQSVYRGRYDAPDGFERKQDLYNEIDEKKMTLQEIEEDYDIAVDKSGLSSAGKEIFLDAY